MVLMGALFTFALQNTNAQPYVCGETTCYNGTKPVCIDNTTGCDVRVTVNYTCGNDSYSRTLVAEKSMPTGFCIPDDCCVESVVFVYAVGGSSSTITITEPGTSYCAGVCVACLTNVCTTWTEESDCDNASGYQFGIGCDSQKDRSASIWFRPGGTFF